MRVRRGGMTLIELIVVLAILGMLAAMMLPALGDTVERTRASMNKATMQDLKRAALAFKEDVGFAPDNVVLLIYPYEACDVKASNHFDKNDSDTCKNLIAFVDSRLTMTALRDSGEGDYGLDKVRTDTLIEEIKRRLDATQGGWRGSYIGGNGHLDAAQIVDHGGAGTEQNTRYFLSAQAIALYDINSTDTLVDLGFDDDADHYFPIKADFNNSGGSGVKIDADARYDVAKYRGRLEGELTVLDPWGTPYEIQFPTQIPSGKTRERYARIVSFGPDRMRDILPDDNGTDIDDDSVLYIYEHNLNSFFYEPEA